MAKIHVPYSKDGMDLNIEDKNLLKVLTSKAHDFKPEKSESQVPKALFCLASLTFIDK